MTWTLLLFLISNTVGAQQRAAETRQPPDTLDGPPLVTAKAWAIGDGKTGELIWSKNPATARNMASTTKIMTAWIVFELAGEDEKLLDETIVFSQRADKTGGSTAGIQEGEQIRIGDVMYGLLLPSGNDAAVALGERFGRHFGQPDSPGEITDEQSLELFIEEMNRRAEKLGMKETEYFDPHGNSKNRASARDLLRLAHESLKNPLLKKYVNTRQHECSATRADESERSITWKNTNQLLGIEGFDGVKTGTTGGAGACLVSSGHRGDDHLLMVVLGSTSKDGRYVDSRNLYRWAWRQRGHTDDRDESKPSKTD